MPRRIALNSLGGAWVDTGSHEGRIADSPETAKPKTAKKRRAKQVLHWSLYGIYVLAFLLVGTLVGVPLGWLVLHPASTIKAATDHARLIIASA